MTVEIRISSDTYFEQKSANTFESYLIGNGKPPGIPHTAVFTPSSILVSWASPRDTSMSKKMRREAGELPPIQIPTHDTSMKRSTRKRQELDARHLTSPPPSAPAPDPEPEPEDDNTEFNDPPSEDVAPDTPSNDETPLSGFDSSEPEGSSFEPMDYSALANKPAIAQAVLERHDESLDTKKLTRPQMITIATQLDDARVS